uniref:SPW repeat-containing integral membrane domain-containing protein n=2 Tax=Aromatoleum anaerobium TaxID=182180 RepID=A0ABX1PFB1_9RHOO
MKVKHWQDPANLVLGLWMVVSPWALAYQAETNAVWSAVIAGALVAALALFELFQVKAWEEWGNMALGLWMVISPWVLGFATSAGAMWNAVIVGLAVAALALWALATDRDIGGWWSHAA